MAWHLMVGKSNKVKMECGHVVTFGPNRSLSTIRKPNLRRLP